MKVNAFYHAQVQHCCLIRGFNAFRVNYLLRFLKRTIKPELTVARIAMAANVQVNGNGF